MRKPRYAIKAYQICKIVRTLTGPGYEMSAFVVEYTLYP